MCICVYVVRVVVMGVCVFVQLEYDDCSAEPVVPPERFQKGDFTHSHTHSLTHLLTHSLTDTCMTFQYVIYYRLTQECACSGFGFG